MVVVSYCRGRPRLVLVNRLEGLSLPRNSATINRPAWHDLVVDRAVKLQHKQTNSSVPHEIWQPDPPAAGYNQEHHHLHAVLKTF